MTKYPQPMVEKLTRPIPDPMVSSFGMWSNVNGRW